jgi:hypothetical protein
MGPRRRADVLTRDVDGETVILDRRRERVHHLNGTASRIWHLCDGVRTPDEIAGLISAEFTDAPGSVADDVRRAIGELVHLGLLDAPEDSRPRMK